MVKTGILLFLTIVFSSCAGTGMAARFGREAMPATRVVSHQDLGVHKDKASAEAAIFDNLGDTYNLYALEYDPWDEWCLKRTLYLDAVGHLNGNLFFDAYQDIGRLFRVNIIREDIRYIVFIHIGMIFYSLETHPRGIIQGWTQWVFEAE